MHPLDSALRLIYGDGYLHEDRSIPGISEIMRIFCIPERLTEWPIMDTKRAPTGGNQMHSFVHSSNQLIEHEERTRPVEYISTLARMK